MQVDHLRGRRVGFDADTGEVRWTFQIPRPVSAAVTLTAVGLVFTADLSGDFYFPATFECTLDSAEAQFARRPRGRRESGRPHDPRGADPQGRAQQRRRQAICRATHATR